MAPITEEMPTLTKENLRQYTRGHFYPKPIKISSDAKVAPIDFCSNYWRAKYNQ